MYQMMPVHNNDYLQTHVVNMINFISLTNLLRLHENNIDYESLT